MTFSKTCLVEAAFFIILALSATAWPDPIDKAEVAYKSRNYKLAMELARPAAEKRNPRAQTLMGKTYEFGLGDYLEAVRWYRKAAAQGDAEGQWLLGHMYVGGWGVKESKMEAMRYFRMAADQGHAPAQDSLGRMFYDKDPAEALKWFRKAAAQNYDPAQHFLGKMYAEGRGVPQDYAKAVEWIGKAAQQRNSWAQLDLGTMYHDGKGVPQDYVEAYKWYSLALSQSIGIVDDQIAMDASEGLGELKGMMTPNQIAEAEKRASQFLLHHRQ